MIKAAAERGWLDGDAAMLESLIAFKRAGADAILTYAALDTAERRDGSAPPTDPPGDLGARPQDDSCAHPVLPS